MKRRLAGERLLSLGLASLIISILANVTTLLVRREIFEIELAYFLIHLLSFDDPICHLTAIHQSPSLGYCRFVGRNSGRYDAVRTRNGGTPVSFQHIKRSLYFDLSIQTPSHYVFRLVRLG